MTLTSDDFQHAVAQHRAGRFDEAERLYQKVLRVDPRHADALHLLGVAALQRQQFEKATEHIRHAISLNSRQAAFHSNLGAAYRGLERMEDAIASFHKATELAPHQAEFYFNLGNAYRQARQTDAACNAYLQALSRNPDYADAHNNLANLFREMGDLSHASSHFARVLEIDPQHAEACLNLGAVRLAQNQLDEAAELCRTALELRPESAAAYNNLGMVHQKQGCFDEAISCYQQALLLNPDDVGSKNNLGAAFLEQGNSTEALALFQQALEQDPDMCEVRANLANAWKAAGQIDEAIACLELLLQDHPDYAPAHNNLGNCWKERGDVDRAMACYRQAIQRNVNLTEAHVNLALVLQNEGETDLALAHYLAAIQRDPSSRLRVQSATILPPIYSSMDDLWRWRDRLTKSVAELISEGVTIDPASEVCETAFYLPYQGFGDREIQEQIGRLHCSSHRTDTTNDGISRRRTAGRIRVGWISRYFHNHTIGRLMRGAIAMIARDEFEVTVISAARHDDEISRFVRDSADRYVTVTDRIPAARRTIAELDLDVLLFTDIGMDPITYSLAHSRLAGVQCATWGHPITTGLPTIDYFLSSRLFETDEAEAHYTERLVHFESPGVFYYRPAPIAHPASRSDFALPDDKHLYGCPQSLFKLHPEFDEVIGGILRQDPLGEVVLLSGARPNWNRLILSRFANSIPDVVDRIRFIPRQRYEDFLRLHTVFDVLLDPLHYSGGNTSYEAFACGMPIVTLPSAYLRGRITHGLYRRMNVLDCVAASPEEYVQKAVRLATDRAYRQDIQEHILACARCLYEDHAAIRELEHFFREVVKG